MNHGNTSNRNVRSLMILSIGKEGRKQIPCEQQKHKLKSCEKERILYRERKVHLTDSQFPARVAKEEPTDQFCGAITLIAKNVRLDRLERNLIRDTLVFLDSLVQNGDWH